ncbi:MAG TPA: sigma-70 family RNA polymerase sigma factor [Acidimicrobiales bacterium]
MKATRSSLDEVYRREFPALMALAYGLSGSRTAAEELVQEAFLAAHRQWSQVGGYDHLGAWLRRVIVNRSVSAVRRRVAEGRALSRLGAHRQVPAVLPEPAEELWRAVRALPRRQAQVVALRYVDDRSIADIAAILDCAEGTVKAHLHAARQALAKALGVEAPAEPRPDQQEAAREH